MGKRFLFVIGLFSMSNAKKIAETG